MASSREVVDVESSCSDSESGVGSEGEVGSWVVDLRLGLCAGLVGTRSEEAEGAEERDEDETEPVWSNNDIAVIEEEDGQDDTEGHDNPDDHEDLDGADDPDDPDDPDYADDYDELDDPDDPDDPDDQEEAGEDLEPGSELELWRGQEFLLLAAPRGTTEIAMQNMSHFAYYGLEGLTASSNHNLEHGNEGVISHLTRNEFLFSEKVEESFRLCPREVFVPDSQKTHSYDMCPLPLTDYEFNISAPEVYAYALEGLDFKEGDRFLDIGCGCGQLTAMGAYLCGKSGSVVGIDLSKRTVDFAKSNVAKLREQSPSYTNASADIDFQVSNVFLLDTESLSSPDDDGKFSKIHCGACCPEERLNDLVALLRPGGKLVAPCDKWLLLVKKMEDGSLRRRNVAPVRYGPLTIPSDLEIIMHKHNRSVARRARLPPHESTFAKDFNGKILHSEASDMFMDDKKSDFAFVVADGDTKKRIPAHKSLLSSRSGHFRALFSSNMMDQNIAETTLPDEFDEETLVECLRYMYMDVADVTQSNCVALLRLAKYYDVSPGIFRLCESVLCANMDASNAASILHLSNWYACEALKQSTIHYILDNLDEVRCTDDWAQLERDTMEDVLIESARRNDTLLKLMGAAAGPS